jgi:hypothetical protein
VDLPCSGGHPPGAPARIFTVIALVLYDRYVPEAEVNQEDLNVGYLEAVFFDRILCVIIISDLIYIIR